MSRTLSTVIVYYKARDALLQCLTAFEEDAAGLDVETLVIDNDSRDAIADKLRIAFPHVRLQTNLDNVGFARGVNQGIANTRGEFVLIINPDCILERGALRTLLGHMKDHPEAGVVGPMLMNPDGSLEYSARSFPSLATFLFNRYSLLTRVFPHNRFSRRYLLSDWDHASVLDVDWLSGACLLARRLAIGHVGPMDEAFFMFNEDVDWCRRMKQGGWKVTYVPQARAVHQVGASRQRVPVRLIVERHRGMIYYFRKHHAPGRLMSWLADAAIYLRAGVMIAANALKLR